jgi:hypothetical protein
LWIYVDERFSFRLVVELSWRGFKSVRLVSRSKLLQSPVMRQGVYVTHDDATAFQPELAERGLAVVVLHSATMDFQEVLPLVTPLVAAISRARPGTFEHVIP